jgi:signal peptidase complex subunit 2
MGKNKSSIKPPAAYEKSSSSATDSDNDNAATLEIQQIDTGDGVKVKQTLDEAVAKLCEELGYEENYKWQNIKLMFMTFACVCACAAQFAPLPFPESRWLLGSCCGTYFLCSGILQVIISFIEDDTFVFLHSKDGSGRGIRLRSNLPRFSEFYTITWEYEDSSAAKNEKTKKGFVEKTSGTWSIGKYFDVEGYFDEDGFMDACQEIVHKFEKGEFDSAEKDEGGKLKAS